MTRRHQRVSLDQEFSLWYPHPVAKRHDLHSPLEGARGPSRIRNLAIGTHMVWLPSSDVDSPLEGTTGQLIFRNLTFGPCAVGLGGIISFHH